MKRWSFIIFLLLVTLDSIHFLKCKGFENPILTSIISYIIPSVVIILVMALTYRFVKDLKVWLVQKKRKKNQKGRKWSMID